MATCKECLHYEACVLNEAYWVKHNAEQACSVFKDKSKYVEQKHGRWSCDSEDGFDNYDWHCEDCGGSIGYRCGNLVFSNYCPNCGADMRCE